MRIFNIPAMRQSLYFLSLLFVGGNAFLGCQPNVVRPSSLSMAVELKPEPEGGEEVTPLSTMAGSRMKKMVRGSVIQKVTRSGKERDLLLGVFRRSGLFACKMNTSLETNHFPFCYGVPTGRS